MARRATLLVVAVLLIGGLLAPGAADAARTQQAQGAPPKAYVIVDVASGTLLLADRPHEPFPPASTAKIMTALTAIERLAPDALVNVSEIAAAQPASRISMQVGQQWPLEHALASLLMASANDAAYAIAETAGGSLDGFVAAMTDSANRMGMEDSTFADPSGLDDKTSFRGGPQMSAFDIAIATRNAMSVPEIAKWAGLRTFEFVDPAGQPRSLTNHNKMLPGASRAYQWATGFKTGFTERAGHTIAATATRDGRSLIAVVLGTYDTYGWAAQLLEQAFAMPNEAGTGERVPEVAVSTFAQRLADQQAFLALARGSQVAAPAPPSSTTSSTPTSSTTTSGATTSTSTSALATAADGLTGRALPAQDPGGGDGSGGGIAVLWIITAVLVILFVAAFVLRRRAVQRQRVRRLAQQRDRNARMRSGGLPVVDGRYRTGSRVGPPVESHVRVHRDDDHRADE